MLDHLRCAASLLFLGSGRSVFCRLQKVVIYLFRHLFCMLVPWSVLSGVAWQFVFFLLATVHFSCYSAWIKFYLKKKVFEKFKSWLRDIDFVLKLQFWVFFSFLFPICKLICFVICMLLALICPSHWNSIVP